MDKAKPFGISKRAVWEAYRRVKENRGTAGCGRNTSTMLAVRLRAGV
jgi:hypothetical protein